MNHGQSTAICPGALPTWLDIAALFAVGLDYTQANTSTSTADARTSEDCLLLDLVVPKAVLDGNLGAPVLVWIHGGGFVSGHKSEQGNGAGLVARSMEQGDEGIIYIAINYRLGLFVSATLAVRAGTLILTQAVGMVGGHGICRAVRDAQRRPA